MLAATNSQFSHLEPYHREDTRQRLRLVLPSATEVEQQLQVIEAVRRSTELRWQDVSRPYMHIILAGHTLTAERLLQLLQWSVRLNMTFESFICYYALPYILEGPRSLVIDLGQIFNAAA